MKPPISDSFTFEIVEKDGEKRVKINATDYYKHFLKTKTKIGDVGTLTLSFKKPTRSEAQLRYYWVIVGLIADYNGNTTEELHDALMRLKFGTKQIKVGKQIVEVRRSISKQAKMSKTDCIELIEFARETAFDLNINIPSAESLGYVSNYQQFDN